MFDNFPTILLSFKWTFSFHGSLIGSFKVVFLHFLLYKMPTNIGKTVSQTWCVRIKNEASVRIFKTTVLKPNWHGFLGIPIATIKPWNLLFKVIVHFLPWDSPPSNPAHLGDYVWFTLSKHLNIIKQIQGNWPWVFLGPRFVEGFCILKGVK